MCLSWRSEHTVHWWQASKGLRTKQFTFRHALDSSLDFVFYNSQQKKKNTQNFFVFTYTDVFICMNHSPIAQNSQVG